MHLWRVVLSPGVRDTHFRMLHFQYLEAPPYFYVLRCNSITSHKPGSRGNFMHLWSVVLSPGVHNTHPTAAGLG
jgi:hypothetical protein